MQLSILDQTLVNPGSTPRESIQHCITLAKLAEQWGYHRFWVTEHHNSTQFACASPAILMARLAAETSSIRIGAGGLLLPNHPVQQVADTFKMLHTLYPGRIDLGIGRGGSESMLVRQLLNPVHTYDIGTYKHNILELSELLGQHDNGLEQPKNLPERWLLSSGMPTARLAAELGLPLSYAHFINPTDGPATVQLYRDHFSPNEVNRIPKISMAVFVICAEEEKDLKRLLRELDFGLLRSDRKKQLPLLPGTAQQYEFSGDEQIQVMENRQKIIWGPPQTISQQLQAFANNYSADELMLLVHTSDQKDKLTIFRLLAKACF